MVKLGGSPAIYVNQKVQAMKIILSTVTFLLLGIVAMGQYTLSGIVRDAETGNPLEGANIILGPSGEAIASNSSGSFAISGVQSGEYSIKVTFVGYKTFTKTIKVSGDVQISIALTPDILLEDKVIVTATRSGEDRKSVV